MARLFSIFIFTDSIREMKTDKIIFIEAVALQSVDAKSRLRNFFEISKANEGFLTIFFSIDETNRFEARERTENMCNLPFRTVIGESFQINDVRGVFANFYRMTEEIVISRESLFEIRGDFTRRLLFRRRLRDGRDQLDSLEIL